MSQNIMFDYVHDSQETFRLMLHAISNPGEIVNIGHHTQKLESEYGHLLAPALTLLDKETSYQVVGDKEFEKLVGALTYANKLDELATYIFVSKQCSIDEITDVLAEADPGTMEDPHTSSTLIISVNKDEKPVSIELDGPGIKDAKIIDISEYIKYWVVQRDLAKYEYPLGIDMYFISKDGDVLSIPRKVKMKG